ncbi:MAG: serpin family protein [Oscillospiraceae bacterium]|nr:serpin family protein [Oscillospiraceae bacterium]
MKKTIALIISLAIVLSLAACTVQEGRDEGADEPEKIVDPAPEPEKPDTPAEKTGYASLTENRPAAEIDWVQEGVDYSSVARLGAGLLKNAEGDNAVISPLSAYIALAMCAEGADGATKTEFENLIGSDTRRVANILLDRLSTDENEFSSANSAWVGWNSQLREQYLNDLVMYYGAEAYLTDFDISIMNEWVNEKTNGLIPSVFSDELDPMTRLVLINTLYMKAKWASPFDAGVTYTDLFHAEGGDKEAEFMHKTAHFEYLSGDNYEGVVLPYKGWGMKFIALKPTSGTVSDLVNTLEGVNPEGESRKIFLSMPKFDVDYTIELTEPLQALGLSGAFTDEADFSLMSEEPLKVSSILQKVKVTVDEDGTEAAAATVVEMVATSAAPGFVEEPYELRLDEPFVYMIVESESNAPLFMGVMNDPS